MKVAQCGLAWTQVTEWNEGVVRAVQDSVAAEEPLEIRVNGAPLSVTMRTPGEDAELAVGFLLTEGIAGTADDIASVRLETTASGAANVVDVELNGQDFDASSMQRNFFAASSCGICGRASIESVRTRNLPVADLDFRIDPEILCRMPDSLRGKQAVFSRTGGLHAAGLFDEAGNLLVLREDIGRHNAVDKVIGWAARKGMLPLKRYVLLVSGRGGFEITQKALAAGIPLLACVSAPSSLAVRLARETGMTLIGFLRGRRFIAYSAEFRCGMVPVVASRK